MTGRWEALFADLAAQEEADERAELQHLVAELTRAEAATVRLVERLAAADAVTIVTSSGEQLRGRITALADTWVLVADGMRETLVPLTAIDHVRGLSRRSQWLNSPSARALTLGTILRTFARNRTYVTWRTSSGAVSGMIERVGADYAELVTATEVLALPWATLEWVRAG